MLLKSARATRAECSGYASASSRISDRCRAAVSSSAHGFLKPHPSIFEAALRLVGAAPGESVMVGDSLAHDIEGARRAGMRVVGELGRIFADSGVVVVAHYEGMSVAEMTDFRLRMKQAGGGVTAYYVIDAQNYVTTDNAQIDGDRISVNAPTSGTVINWRATQGAQLQQDQVVGRIRQQGAFAKQQTLASNFYQMQLTVKYTF